MASEIPTQLVAVASMADLDQTEICQLKQALAQVQAKIEVLEGLRDLEATEVALLRAQVDELTRLAEALRERNRRLEGELARLRDEAQQLEEALGHACFSEPEPEVETEPEPELELDDVDYDCDYDGDGDSSLPNSPVDNEDVALDLYGLDIDDDAKDGGIAVSDGGIDGYASRRRFNGYASDDSGFA
ncbi:hypothetical protein CTA1_12718 [Colletotrichum tanaceti]|uniref:Uncharacterized protein n=1 Tax=Colletotrichum tanaceti TaxID=1306861 RepID=A0A4U6X7L4_9PEZI|nr:hypothetical protein CTA1_12718 [Colletotrichum tanaceti]